MSADAYGPLQPGQTFIALIGGPTNEVGAYDENYPGPGLTGKLSVQIDPLAGGAAILAPTTTGVQEQAPGSAIYAVQLTAPQATGSYTVLWTLPSGLTWGQTLEVDTSIPVTPPSGSGNTPVYVQQADVLADPTFISSGQEPPSSTVPAGGTLSPFDALIVVSELDIDSILGFWIRDPTTGRKINMSNIIPVAPISPFPGELFAPYQRGITIFQKAALQRAVIAQIIYRLRMGPEFFSTVPKTQVSGPQFSYTYGTGSSGPPKIGPAVHEHLRGMGLVRNVARALV